MYCFNCHQPLPEGSYRCPNCGEPILQPEPETGGSEHDAGLKHQFA